MLKLKWLAIAAILSLLTTRPAAAQLCYVVWSNGLGQNLDALCRGESVLPSATVTTVDSRLVFNDLDIKGTVDNSGVGRVVGSVTNTSSGPVRVDYIEFQLSDRRNQEVLGSVNTYLGVTLQAGQTARINQAFDNDVIGRRPYGRVGVGVSRWI